MVLDTSALAAEVDRFVAAVDKLAEALNNAGADDAANQAAIDALAAKMKAGNDQVDALTTPPAPVEESVV